VVNENETVMIITDPVKVTEKHPLILEIEVKAVFIL